MKKIIFSLFVLGACSFNACKQAEMDSAQVEAKVNELAATKIQEVEAAANTACEAKMASDLQRMTDSLVHEAQMAAAGN